MVDLADKPAGRPIQPHDIELVTSLVKLHLEGQGRVAEALDRIGVAIQRHADIQWERYKLRRLTLGVDRLEAEVSMGPVERGNAEMRAMDRWKEAIDDGEVPDLRKLVDEEMRREKPGG